MVFAPVTDKTSTVIPILELNIGPLKNSERWKILFKKYSFTFALFGSSVKEFGQDTLKSGFPKDAKSTTSPRISGEAAKPGTLLFN